ncbi:MAG: FkbM family methyltransferase [Rhodospirillales bacterium]|nr:FkbM family methyltransferase [Rhodospirillales bacterium]
MVASQSYSYARMIMQFARFRAEKRENATFEHSGETFHFHIAGDNLGLDMFHVAGHFFEEAELDYCRTRVAVGGTIVDVGANVGNHALYFARHLRPACLIPVEPNPAAVTRLKENLSLNGLSVDERGFGVGVGQSVGRVGLALHEHGDLVVGRLSGTGEVPVLPLDDLLDRRVDFLKIDVEGMEMEVLAGARRILTEDRPLVLIEVQEAGFEAFHAFCREAGYAIEKNFPAHCYANHFLCPVERQG